MHPSDRRAFLGTSLGGLAAALGGAPLLGQGPMPAEKATFFPDALFLTWQRDPTTTMTVQWVGRSGEVPDTTVTAVSHRGDVRTAACRERPFPLTNLTVFRAELTGLTPGTDYRFRIGLRSPTYRFRTMPAKLTDTFQFVSGGDAGVNPHVIANNILAAKQDPMFALFGGDLAYENAVSPFVFLGFLRNYGRQMIDSRGRLIPMVACLGNHEVRGGYNKKRQDAPFFFSVFDGLFADHSFGVLDFGDYLSLVLLDSGHIAPINGEQADWLDRTLAERADRPHLVAVNHVPAYPSFRKPDGGLLGKGTGEGNRRFWVPLFEKHNVDFVLEHHDHTFKRTLPLKDGLPDPNGIVYLGDGSWGKLRPPQPPEKRPYLAHVSESYHLTLHRIEGGQRFHLALEEGGKVVDVCMTQKRPRRNGARAS